MEGLHARVEVAQLKGRSLAHVGVYYGEEAGFGAGALSQLLIRHSSLLEEGLIAAFQEDIAWLMGQLDPSTKHLASDHPALSYVPQDVGLGDVATPNVHRLVHDLPLCDASILLVESAGQVPAAVALPGGAQIAVAVAGLLHIEDLLVGGLGQLLLPRLLRREVVHELDGNVHGAALSLLRVLAVLPGRRLLDRKVVEAHVRGAHLRHLPDAGPRSIGARAVEPAEVARVVVGQGGSHSVAEDLGELLQAVLSLMDVLV
mmetsp:Transcript_40730/g.117615  ORF Transcript_40730/g.117615 Transcript_40730/m.117615 type:complete len:259 (-) Transcript_40730:1304-2080(-)